MNTSPHHPHHEHHDVHQQRLLWFFSFCNQRSSSRSNSSSNGSTTSHNGTGRRTVNTRRKSASNRNKFAIQYQQQAQQLQRQSSNVFGLDLIEHTQKFGDDDSVPYIVKTCTRFIEKNGIIFGIYRLSGMRANIQKLRQSFDKNPKNFMIDSEAISNDVHAVACVLKQYFRELPTPLMTFHMYEKFIELFRYGNKSQASSNESQLKVQRQSQFTTSASDSQLISLSSVVTTATSNVDYQVKLGDLRKLLLQLPRAHYRTLKFLMRHLACIAANGPKTGMDSKNVAIIWAPNLLKPRELELSAGRERETLQVIGLQAVITEQLIKNQEFLFDDVDVDVK